MKVIKNITDTIDIKITDLNCWIDKMDSVFWQISKLKNGQSVDINLKNISFIRPSGVILLLLICKEIFDKTRNVISITGLNESVVAYLERVGFLEYDFVNISLNIPWWKRLTKSAKSYSVIEISEMSSYNDVANFAEKANEIFIEWFPGKKYEIYRANVNTIIMEICNNSIDHSSGCEGINGKCYCMLQRYNHLYSLQNRVEICLSIGDLGIGIRDHLRKKHGWVGSSESEYIEKAIGGLSGRSDESGGLGLPRIKSITSENNGLLLLRSGKGAVKLDDSINHIDCKHGFRGTQCYFNLSPIVS